MINKISLSNFGPIASLDWKNLSKINLVIGDNGSGKTFLLKALYCAMKTIESYKRGKNPDPLDIILKNRLTWTFEVDKIGDLVNVSQKTKNDPLRFSFEFEKKEFSFSFGKNTETEIGKIEFKNKTQTRKDNSIFLPAKEVLSLQSVILRTRTEGEFAFDDTYHELASALYPKRIAGGRNFEKFAKSKEKLEEILKGRIEYDEHAKAWRFTSKGKSYDIGVTAEGVKKIAILDTLLSNRYLTPKSVVFIDEIESALHPTAISNLLDIIVLLSEIGIQFFIASHSYFVIKKLYLIAQKEKMSIPILSKNGEKWNDSDLKNGMPDNGIVNESIALYRQNMELE